VLEPSGVGLPEPDVVTAALRLNDELADVRDCLECAHTTVRLVLTPETVVVAEARRTLATLALFGYPVDSVIVNRQFPTQHAEVGGSPWLRSWAVAQRAVLDDITSSFSPLPILHAGYAALEPVGPEALARLAEEVYADVDPLDDASESLSPHVERHGDHFLLSVPLPLADRSALDLARVGDDLVVTVAGFRRVWALPSGLRRCRVVSATLVSGRLEVRLQPDPEQWRPRG
jgi:arsenite-transporting ATPase